MQQLLARPGGNVIITARQASPHHGAFGGMWTNVLSAISMVLLVKLGQSRGLNFEPPNALQEQT